MLRTIMELSEDRFETCRLICEAAVGFCAVRGIPIQTSRFAQDPAPYAFSPADLVVMSEAFAAHGMRDVPAATLSIASVASLHRFAPPDTIDRFMSFNVVRGPVTTRYVVSHAFHQLASHDRIIEFDTAADVSTKGARAAGSVFGLIAIGDHVFDGKELQHGTMRYAEQQAIADTFERLT